MLPWTNSRGALTFDQALLQPENPDLPLGRNSPPRVCSLDGAIDVLRERLLKNRNVEFISHMPLGSYTFLPRRSSVSLGTGFEKAVARMLGIEDDIQRNMYNTFKGRGMQFVPGTGGMPYEFKGDVAKKRRTVRSARHPTLGRCRRLPSQRRYCRRGG